MRLSVLAAPLALAALVAVTTTGRAHAEQSIIKNPGDHPSYRFEAEPHALVGYGGPFLGGRNEIGVGFRGAVVLLDNGFIPSINNSIALGFGIDAFLRSGTLFIPVVMQWNFWLSTHWSVFGEPGIGIAPNTKGNRDSVHFTGYAGGRFHFNDRIALTLRLGYPSVSVGASFLF